MTSTPQPEGEWVADGDQVRRRVPNIAYYSVGNRQEATRLADQLNALQSEVTTLRQERDEEVEASKELARLERHWFEQVSTLQTALSEARAKADLADEEWGTDDPVDADEYGHHCAWCGATAHETAEYQAYQRRLREFTAPVRGLRPIQMPIGPYEAVPDFPWMVVEEHSPSCLWLRYQALTKLGDQLVEKGITE